MGKYRSGGAASALLADMIARLWMGLIGFGFRLLYNEMAFTYDLVSRVVSLGAWRCWQRAALGFLPTEGRVLEIAHGTGNLQIDLYAQGHRSVACDLSPAMGRIAQGKLKRARIPTRLTRCQAQALPYVEGAFGAVVSTFPAPFIVESDTLREIHRVLETDGVLVIVPNAIFTGGSIGETILEWLYRVTGQRPVGENMLYPSIEALFTPHGFKAAIHQVDCPRSRATVIVAHKIP